ncbi:hypothetical protein H4S06_002315 [Coemansia sp. BCRC 34490]|nr:hypothetical protein H4S06_002315 [Coemansia sp. BCRC 34490]
MTGVFTRKRTDNAHDDSSSASAGLQDTVKRIKTELKIDLEADVDAQPVAGVAEGEHQVFQDAGLPIPGRLAQSYTHFSDHLSSEQAAAAAEEENTTTTSTAIDNDDDDDGYVVGVDEAGRGPVLGPMVYAMCYCRQSDYAELSGLGFADSKQLSEPQRMRLFKQLQQSITRSTTTTLKAGWAVRCISPHDISTSMLRRSKYNLNALAHDATIQLLVQVVGRLRSSSSSSNNISGGRVKHVYIDTVGPPASYQRKLELLFPDIAFTVAKKADSLYPIVSAASVCAKVIRDAHLANWVFSEPLLQSQPADEHGCPGRVSRSFGSGYPGDPRTVAWLKQSLDPVFGYPDIIRFSWSTCAKILDDAGAPVVWPDDQQNETAPGSRNPTIRGLFASSADAARQRSRFFSRKRPVLLNTTL